MLSKKAQRAVDRAASDREKFDKTLKKFDEKKDNTLIKKGKTRIDKNSFKSRNGL